MLPNLVKTTIAAFDTTASWSNGYAFVSGAEDLKFKPRAGQIKHS